MSKPHFPLRCPECGSTFVTIGRLTGVRQPDDEAKCEDCAWKGMLWLAWEAGAKVKR